MSRLMRVYYFGLLGAIGGVIGWQVSNLLGLSFTPNVYLSEVVVGALIGLCIGALIGLGEGLSSRNPIQTLRSGAISGALGLAGGAIGLPIAEGLFQLLGGGILSRAIGWGVFGLLIGVASGINGGSQMWKSALGGLIGGILGGFLLETARRWLQDPLLGKAAGLLLLGASVGVFIALIVYLLSRAWLEVKSGKLKGTEFILDKFLKKQGPSAFIGSDALKADIVLPDPDIAPQHAMLKGADTSFTLKDMSLNGTFVNNQRIEQASLKNRQTIKMGNTELIYHEKR
ncbi:MAG: FHA domain-containing protein [Anaerolineales bacterium]|nr:FHA domain-containing protein [Anaerolineales bacterium]